jgi:hypothetical protein
MKLFEKKKTIFPKTICGPFLVHGRKPAILPWHVPIKLPCQFYHCIVMIINKYKCHLFLARVKCCTIAKIRVLLVVIKRLLYFVKMRI